ncbi:hypothetical protein OCA99_23720 [Bacillus cereus]|nr:hypothetical protein [Bacillus cereus]
MKPQDIKEDKSLWEKKHLEGVGNVLLVEESYYDEIIDMVKDLDKANRYLRHELSKAQGFIEEDNGYMS